MFIISLRNFDNPDFAAFVVTGHQQAERTKLTIVKDDKFSVKDIKGNGDKTIDGFLLPKGTPDFMNEERLNQKIHNIFEGSTEYERHRRSDGGGDFSTLA